MKAKWTGTRLTHGSEGESRRSTCWWFGAWQAEGRCIEGIRVRRSKRFFEAHEKAFEFFGGVFHRLRYDNLSLAVRKILRGHQREQTERFIMFRSHWSFESEFCNPSRGNEKGGVESEVGYFRRNHWTPVPEFTDWEELNDYLLTCCRKEEKRHISGKAHAVGVGMEYEREHLLPLATQGFELEERRIGPGG